MNIEKQLEQYIRENNTLQSAIHDFSELAERRLSSFYKELEEVKSERDKLTTKLSFVSDSATSLLKMLEQDYNHPWPNEDEETRVYRGKVLRDMKYVINLLT